jgi:multiple antibiotic resistance protein
MSLISVVLTLFFVMDPLGNVPFFITTLKDIPRARQSVILKRELIIALAIMFAALLFGTRLMLWMGIDKPSLSIAGGIILFLIAIKMIFPMKEPDGFAQSPEGEPFIVPLAVPMIVGPSVLSMVMIMPSSAGLLNGALAVIIAWVLNAVILLSSFKLNRLLGERAMIAITKLMGMILTTISVQMFISGLRQTLAVR